MIKIDNNADNLEIIDNINQNPKIVNNLSDRHNNVTGVSRMTNNLVIGNNKLNLSRQDLISHGCVNCVWKFHGMCPQGLTGTDYKSEGICQDFIDFLLSLVNDGDSKNVLWENYNLYVLRLQSLEDYRTYTEMCSELKKLESEGYTDTNKLELLEMQRNSMKMWWYKLNQSVLQSLGRVVDREKRQVNDSKPKLSVQQLNILIQDSSDKLLDYEKKHNAGGVK